MEGELRVKKALGREAIRYFRLEGTKLSYSKDKSMPPARKNILEASNCILNDLKGNMFLFHCRSPARTLRLQAETEEDKTKWLSALFEAKLNTKGAASASSASCSLQ
eukprot:m.138014 g.138014  ORF g.138014 m.138014 type:complete len:107 (-) comp20252_c0_seq2:111-431(-)